MKRYAVRLLALVLAAVILLPITLTVSAGAPKYRNTYTNTGNQRKDIIGVALTQVGYCEGKNNDTKYGSWIGMPYQPWCAAFVSWCARQANISTSILEKTARASASYFDIPYYCGSWYTPRSGDLFFSRGFDHVGLVYYVEGDYFYTIEGNSNDNGSIDGYTVLINKRKVSGYYFGVPKYKGCDKSHDYILEQENAHPHKTYYECETCGDKYYTGYTETVASCDSCVPCSCKKSKAGYYRCNTGDVPLKLWTGHERTGDTVGRIPNGAVVYAHGVSENGWAYVEYDGIRGHVELSYLKAYYPAPQAPRLSMDTETPIVGDTLQITWEEDPQAEEYALRLYENGERTVSKNMGLERSYTLENAPEGEYELRVRAANETGWSDWSSLKFTIRGTVTLTYDPSGGTDAPRQQTLTAGKPGVISDQLPQKEGHTFLGWTETPQGTSVQYPSGGSVTAEKDLTLYAVWKENAAQPLELRIEELPKTVYLLGDDLDTQGLALYLTYSDGSQQRITEGFTAEGFSSDAVGSKTVTLSYAGLTASYEVQVISHIPGDMTGDKTVDRDDVMLLLWHINFPEEFPVEVPADFTADGRVDRDDVMQLLWHINFPEDFPLN